MMQYFSFLSSSSTHQRKKEKKALSTNAGRAVLVEGLARKWAEVFTLD